MTEPWWRRPKLTKPALPPQHSFPAYATRCDRCGLQLIYAGQPDAPPCISDEMLKAHRAVQHIMGRRRP